jgi:hypothetical protein
MIVFILVFFSKNFQNKLHRNVYTTPVRRVFNPYNILRGFLQLHLQNKLQANINKMCITLSQPYLCFSWVSS